MVSAQPASAAWPGQSLGLPESGPRSVGRVGRRILGLIIDWGLAYLLAWAFLPHRNGTVDGGWTLAVFAVEQILFLILLNGSPGHLIVGLRLVPIVPAPLGVWRPIVRTLLLCLVIPAAIWDRDQRGLHDRAAGTVLVRC